MRCVARRVVIGAVAVGMWLGGSGIETAKAEETTYLEQFGWGMAAIGANIGYMPAKFVYAMAGGVVGLLAYGVTVGDTDAVHRILSPSVGGTWVLTPEMLRGEEPIFYNGESFTEEREEPGGRR